jgi:hypothetical protein
MMKSNSYINPLFLVKYLYNNILRITSFFMFGLKAAHYRASTLFAICTALNFFSVFEVVGLQLRANVIGVTIFLWVLIAMFIFSRNGFHEKISKQFNNDGYYTKLFGILLVLCYITISFYIFLKLRF